jgi:hypothetical protein
MACLLNGLQVATQMDLLMRSIGSTDQRRQVSFGKVRPNSMSTSYFSIGKYARRAFSTSAFNDFSSGSTCRSESVWINGSPGWRGVSRRLNFGQS